MQGKAHTGCKIPYFNWNIEIIMERNWGCIYYNFDKIIWKIFEISLQYLLKLYANIIISNYDNQKVSLQYLLKLHANIIISNYDNQKIYMFLSKLWQFLKRYVKVIVNNSISIQ